MEIILSNIYDLIELLMRSDPAIYRIMFYDPTGTEIFQSAKTWNKEKKYTSVGAMISQIFKNADKFFGFMKKSFYDKFILQWNFEGVVILAADCPAGFIALLAEPDVDLGFVKNILIRQALPAYIKIIKPIME